MSKTLKNALISVVGLVLVSVTITVFFLLGFEKTAVNYIAISFLVFSEIALCAGVLVTGRSNTDKTFISAGINSALSFYFFVTLVLVLFVDLFQDNYKGLIALEITALGAILIIAILIILFAGKINAANTKILSDRKLMQLCEKRIYDLMVKSENKVYETQLNKIYESFKYGDKIGVSSVDEKIVGAIMKLEKEIATDGTTDIFENINALISQRNMEIAETKRGGF